MRPRCRILASRERSGGPSLATRGGTDGPVRHRLAVRVIQVDFAHRTERLPVTPNRGLYSQAVGRHLALELIGHAAERAGITIHVADVLLKHQRWIELADER